MFILHSGLENILSGNIVELLTVSLDNSEQDGPTFLLYKRQSPRLLFLCNSKAIPTARLKSMYEIQGEERRLLESSIFLNFL